MRRVALLACLAALASPAHATCKLGRAGVMKLTIAGSRLYVPVTMNETEGVFMVDTGSQLSILTGPYAEKAGIGIDAHAGQVYMQGMGGKHTLPVNQGHVRSAKIADIPFHDWEFPIVPAGAGNITPTERDGLLGMDFLHYFDLDFDLEAHTLTLWRVIGCTDIHPEWQGDYDAIPLKHTARQGVTLPIYIDEAFLDVEFDTGANGALISREAAAQAGAPASVLARDANSQGAGIGGAFHSVAHQFKLLLIGSGQFPNAWIEVNMDPKAAGEADGVIDWRFLRARKFWLSYSTSTLFVQKATKS